MKRPAPKGEPGPSSSKRTGWTLIPRNDSSSESESEDEQFRGLGREDSDEYYDSDESNISDLIDDEGERYFFSSPFKM